MLLLLFAISASCFLSFFPLLLLLLFVFAAFCYRLFLLVLFWASSLGAFCFPTSALGGRRCALPPNPPPAFFLFRPGPLHTLQPQPQPQQQQQQQQQQHVKIHAHFPHGCGTHFTVHTYFYTLAQGVKGCTRVESKLHVLTSGLSAVSDC